MIKKKRILFVVRDLNVGGIEKSLLALLRVLPSERYEIDLGVINAKGGFADSIPPNVNLIEIPVLHDNFPNVSGRFKSIAENLKKGNLKNAVKIPLLYIKSKIAGTLIPLYSHFINRRTDNMPPYDVAVAYQGPNELIDYYVSKVVEARNKYVWIHFDIDRFFIRKETTLQCYRDFDRIMVVSNHAKEIFDARFPELKDKTEVFLNIIDKEENLKLAAQPDVFTPDSSRLNIATVGRIAWQKAQDKAVEAAAILKDRKINFHWYFIGDGPQRALFEKMAKDRGVDDCVTFIGSTQNPYPFMARCDVYVQPSRFEGYCIAIGEAKLFGTPIVATDFVGASEQLDSLVNALIIPEPDPFMIADAIVRAAEIGRITPETDGNPPQVKRLTTLFSHTDEL